jgi:hypothetical protein
LNQRFVINSIMHAGVETVGIYIENPNTILPMACYCREMHQDMILSALEWTSDDGVVRAYHHACIACIYKSHTVRGIRTQLVKAPSSPSPTGLFTQYEGSRHAAKPLM